MRPPHRPTDPPTHRPTDPPTHRPTKPAAVQTNGRCSPYGDRDRWSKIIGTNLWGVINGVHVFCEGMIAQGTPAIIVNTGSKQGITCPPGDTAYNVSKAGVKVLTEQLQHKLRNTPGCKVSAFLLVPGWTITAIAQKAVEWVDGGEAPEDAARVEAALAKVPYEQSGRPTPAGAWVPDQVVDVLFDALRTGAPFYVICRDDEMSDAKMNAGIQWAAEDMIWKRVPLSRWSGEYSGLWGARSAGL